MSVKLHIKKGDTVCVIAGDSKGQQGKVLKVEVSKQRAIVEGVNLVKKATKPNAKEHPSGCSFLLFPYFPAAILSLWRFIKYTARFTVTTARLNRYTAST